MGELEVLKRTGVTCGKVQTARGKQVGAEVHLKALVRVCYAIGSDASDASDAKANLVEVVLHLEHALALGYSAGAPDTTHEVTKTTSKRHA